METIGWIGSLMLAFCGLPELCKSLKSGRCALSPAFLFMWGVGEILVLIPIISKDLGLFLVFNYGVNLAIIGGLVWVKLRSNLQKRN